MISDIAKRGFDLIIAAIVLIITFPLLLIIALLLRFTGEGEVLYLQERIGLNNEPFKIWKFATMLKDSPSMGTQDVTIKNDPRVLPMGKFLRKTKINELPQVINVLMGEMSIVGARPLMAQSFNQYNEATRAVIYNSPPGITGIGSLVFRDEESIIDASGLDPREFYEQEILPYKGELERWYQKNRSIWTDAKIVFLTAWSIVFSNSKLVFTMFASLPRRDFCTNA